MGCAVVGCRKAVAEGHAFCATHKHIADSLQRTGHVSAESKRRAYVSLTPKEKRKLLPRGQRGSTGRKVTVRQMTPEEMAALV